METYTRANGFIWGHPRSPAHFLEEGELIRLMPSGARLVAYEEGQTPEGWCVARICFVKPGAGTPLAYGLAP